MFPSRGCQYATWAAVITQERFPKVSQPRIITHAPWPEPRKATAGGRHAITVEEATGGHAACCQPAYDRGRRIWIAGMYIWRSVTAHGRQRGRPAKFGLSQTWYYYICIARAEHRPCLYSTKQPGLLPAAKCISLLAQHPQVSAM